jgi:hypothetical protein
MRGAGVFGGVIARCMSELGARNPCDGVNDGKCGLESESAASDISMVGMAWS